MEALVALVNKRQEIDVDQLRLQILEARGRVDADERGIILDGIGREGQVGQDALGQVVQGLEFGAALAFPTQFTASQILRGAAQEGEEIAAIPLGKERLQGGAFRVGQVGCQQIEEACLL